MTSIPLQRDASRTGFFTRTELVFIGMIVCMIGVNLWVDYQGTAHRIGWESFALPGTGAVGLAILGAYYRAAYKNYEWLGKAAVTVSLASVFGIMLGILFHQQMPRPEPVLTEALLAMDEWFGYHWPAAVAWVSEVPFLGTFLRYVYLSSFLQIMLLFVVLAWLSKFKQLDFMMYTNALSLALVYVVWQAYPNLSQSTYFPIPVEMAEKVNLVTHSTYGAILLEYARNGLPVITLDSIIGAVAFPSYHTVMCALVVVFAWRTFLFWPYLIMNIIMIPGILVHGAHHVADLFGGTAVMLVAMIPAFLIVNACYRAER